MCGIAGIVDLKGRDIDRDTLKRMASILTHRGPDDEGIMISRGKAYNAGLVHRRLSIIDLSDNAREPISNENGTIWLVYNGEIYNFQALRDMLVKKGHTFKSRTDAEVLIHLYEEFGEDCLFYLRGMFAFCIWDEKNDTVFLARDRVGKKPLTYFYDGNVFVFASELKAVLEDKRVPKELDFTSVADFFTYGYVPSPKTIFKKIHKIPPAHTLRLDKNGIRLKRYWEPNYNDKIYLRKDSDYEEEIARLFNEAVRLRLVSDVPLGVFLSGGIDSSAVLAFMAKNLTYPIKSFSIGFEESSYNELKFARSMAKKYNTDHKEFIVKMDAVNILPKLVWHYNEPFADSSAIPTYYVSKMTRECVKVALCGDGGDEAFGGYNRYIAFRYLMGNSRLRNALSGDVLKLLRIFNPFIGGAKSYKYAVRFFESMLFSENISDRYLYIMGMFPDLNIFTAKFFENLSGYNSAGYFRAKFNGLGMEDKNESCMKLDFLTYLPEDLTVKADIAAMANSLEVRSPFLDHKLLEFALRIPFDKKIRFTKTKVILKNYLKRNNLLTKDILGRKKQGFAVPIGEWFKKELKKYLEDMLSESVFIKNGFLDRRSIDVLIKEHNSGAKDHAHRLWSILNFELWHKIFIEGVSPESLVGKK